MLHDKRLRRILDPRGKLVMFLVAGVAMATLVMTAPGQENDPAEDAGADRPPGEEMVLIPGGDFTMGAEDVDDAPLHEVHVDTFYLDRHEVTNARYLEFCEQTDHRLPALWGKADYKCGPDFPEHPVVSVNWRDATAYAEWCGKRLPTEAEWEYAARGGLVGKNFPHGDETDSTLVNFKSTGTRPVGSYPPNGFGLYEMSGNVVEWVNDYYDDEYYTTGPRVNPPGPEDGKFRVIRGGGYFSGAYCNRVYHRNGLPGGFVDFNVGFRCARDYP